MHNSSFTCSSHLTWVQMHAKSIKGHQYLQAFSTMAIDNGFIQMSHAPNVWKTAKRPGLSLELLTHPVTPMRAMPANQASSQRFGEAELNTQHMMQIGNQGHIYIKLRSVGSLGLLTKGKFEGIPYFMGQRLELSGAQCCLSVLTV